MRGGVDLSIGPFGWKSPRKPPWTIGYASTYAGNTWRKGAMERLMEVVYPSWNRFFGIFNGKTY